uniref:Nuclear prelamin A recognition factorlike protein pu n=1 Tax=Albugo laibachii Nc14 TaxID=890382 RepID=F0WK24_9STRA|nr:nuclear prelamin A recognition factorlike protein pu [Albugo laibachii Nc14]|eukprot:CCA21626.1 nuclear prelamin A recognition factorlike protein pu [Albugo laibachii Nc14]
MTGVFTVELNKLFELASVFLGDLNDYIQPSQACINPLFIDTKNPLVSEIQSDPKRVILAIEDDWNQDVKLPETKPNIIRETAQQRATISLDDCLACSGCVTSAETVLITQQSYADMLEKLQSVPSPYFKKIMTISSASRASLAAHFNLPIHVVHCKLVTFFRTLGFDLIFDTGCFENIMLLEARQEFLYRYQNQTPTPWNHTQTESDSDPAIPTALPMLASSCPGWICYAEKAQPNALPFIDTTKSPQQIAGTIVKDFLSREFLIESDQVFHVTLMPCFDKKLEASRKDFQRSEDNRDVDCVLATSELIDLFQAQKIEFKDLKEASLTQKEAQMSGISPDGQIVYGSSPFASSGGQLEHIFRYAAKNLFNVDICGPLEYSIGRNPDFREVSLSIQGKVVLHFAIAYGFRNIQSVITKLRRGKCSYHYVEVMACPSGCLNGGGQIKPSSSLESSTLVSSVTKRFQELREYDPQKDAFCKYIYEKYFDKPFSQVAQRALHTKYRRVPKLEQANPLGIRW